MGDALGKRADRGFYAAKAVSALPAPFRAAAELWLQQPDRGSFDSLIAQAQAVLVPPGADPTPAHLADPTRAAMEGILRRLSATLSGPNQREMRKQIVSDSEEWQRWFTESSELRDPSFVLDGELNMYSRAVAEILARGVRDWIVVHDGKILADGVGAVLRRQDDGFGAVLDALDDSSGLSKARSRLRNDSRRFLDSVGAQFAVIGDDEKVGDVDGGADHTGGEGTSADGQDPFPLFVARDLHDRVVARVLSGETSPLVVVGDAGFGKTSLLWGVARALDATATHYSIALSAAWFPGVARAGEERVNGPDIVAALAARDRRDRTPVVLLDTADLLLHSTASVLATLELMDELSGIDVPLVLTVRPSEAMKLDPQTSRFTLERYTPEEMDAAVRALARRYLPDYEPHELVALVTTARVRQLAVLDVLQSPLLLTMLFDLCRGVPPSMDMDITSLYRRYWRDRIETDRRDDAIHQKADDLTAIACRVALGMLAEGSPDVEIDPLLDAAAQMEFPTGVPQPALALDALERRGVVVQTAGRARFFHQTLFEFVAAQALVRRRDPVAEASRLVDHVLAEPLDLFVGAVLEQLLVLLADTHSRQDAVGQLIARLLASESATATQIAVAVCAKQSVFEAQLATRIGQLPAAALRRYLAFVPQVLDLDVTDMVSQIWRARDADVQHDVVRTIARIARRDPQRMGALIREIDLIRHVTARTPKILSNAVDFYTALFALSKSDPDLVREGIEAIFGAAPGPEPLILLLGFVAAHWEAIGDDRYLAQIYRMVDDALGGRDRVPARSVRNALGAVLDQEHQRAPLNSADERIARAKRVLAAVGSNTATFENGAELVALSSEMLRLTTAADAIPYLDAIFQIPAEDGPPQIVGLLVAPLLATDSAIRASLEDRVRTVLREGLPSRDNSPDLTSAQRWAIAARRALLDERVPPAVAAACVDGAGTFGATDAIGFWGDPSYALSVLAVAAAGGHSEARVVVEKLAETPQVLDRAAQRMFLDTARAYVAGDPLVAQASISVAMDCDALGILQEMARQPACKVVLEQRSEDIRYCLAAHFAGNNEMQKHATTLWQSLQEAGILQATIDELDTTIQHVRARSDKARLVRMMAPAVRADADQAAAAARWLEDQLPTTLPSLVDARRAVRQGILGSHGTPDDWPLLLELSLSPGASAGKSIEPTMLHDASTFIRRTIARGERAAATEQFLEVATRAAALTLSAKQRKNLSGVFFGIAIELAVRGAPAQVATLAKSLSGLTTTLAEAIVRAALTRPENRAVIERALAEGELIGDLAQYTARKLNELPREIGRGSLPALYLAA